MNITLKWQDEDGEDVSHSFPSKFEVCDKCGGHGSHLHDAIRSNAYTHEEFDEAFEDSESKSEYFSNGGRYDVTCTVCRGKNVVPVVDEAILSESQKERYNAYQEWLAEEEAEEEADSRLRLDECGGRWC